MNLRDEFDQHLLNVKHVPNHISFSKGPMLFSEDNSHANKTSRRDLQDTVAFDRVLNLSKKQLRATSRDDLGNQEYWCGKIPVCRFVISYRVATPGRDGDSGDSDSGDNGDSGNSGAGDSGDSRDT
jgi:hypothetical protein